MLKYKYFLVFSGGNSMMIGEVFVDGQNRNVYCNSKTPINDTKMYFDIGALTNPKFATIPSCYTLSVRNPDKMILFALRDGTRCLSPHVLTNEILLCE